MIPGTVILSGIVGSTAYGLSHEGSDIDRLGIFAAPTIAFHGLHRPAEFHVTTAPDATYHEACKAVRLMLSCNPTVTEIAWLPDDLYEVRTPLGDDLITIRSSLLCARRVKDAFLGYAMSQFRRLENRGDGSFSADTRRRTAKHSRHLMRLVTQGRELYRTGVLTVRLENPQEFFDFGERVAAGDLAVAQAFLAQAQEDFAAIRTPLSAQPDEAAAEAWLLHVRAEFLNAPG